MFKKITYTTIMLGSIVLAEDYSPKYININDAVGTKYNAITEDTVYLQGFMLGTIGAISSLPEGISKWDKNSLKDRSLSDRWYDNVSNGPVWDKDNNYVNYVGHPLAGATYYTLARNDGLSIAESSTYSFLMSTFFWEYGYEAFSEIPSIQDLIVTPLFGSIVGEYAYGLQLDINRNGGEIFGSKTIGNFGYFCLNPIGSLTEYMKNGITKDIRVNMYYSVYNFESDNVGFKIDLKF
jgi:hypothetical protein